jgi:enoyl-CoA hydratase
MVEVPPSALVRAERRERALLLTLDHPPVNVLSREVLEALVRALRDAEADPEVRAVVLASAAEKAFAAGANIREMAPMHSDEARVHGARGQEVTRAIEELPLPVIAAVHGVCFGGGCEIALACDFVLASDDAQFGQPEINLGVMPGWGGTRRLPRRIGAAAARRWIYTGRPVGAAEALRAGLVDRVVARPELVAEALSLARELAQKPPLALAAAKSAVLHAIDPTIEDGLAYERELWARLFDTDDQKEAMRAFLEKRPVPARSRADWSTRSAGFPWDPARAAAGAEGRKKNKPGASGRE